MEAFTYPFWGEEITSIIWKLYILSMILPKWWAFATHFSDSRAAWMLKKADPMLSRIDLWRWPKLVARSVLNTMELWLMACLRSKCWLKHFFVCTLIRPSWCLDVRGEDCEQSRTTQERTLLWSDRTNRKPKANHPEFDFPIGRQQPAWWAWLPHSHWTSRKPKLSLAHFVGSIRTGVKTWKEWRNPETNENLTKENTLLITYLSQSGNDAINNEQVNACFGTPNAHKR